MSVGLVTPEVERGFGSRRAPSKLALRVPQV